MTGNDAVVGVNGGGQADLDVFCLRLGDLQGGLQLVKLDDLGHGGAGDHVLAYLQRDGKLRQHAGDAGPHMQRRFLLLIQIELGLGLLHLGTSRGKLDFYRLLIHVKLLFGELLLLRQLVGSVLGRIGDIAGDHAQLIELLVGLRLALVLCVGGVDLRGGNLLVHQCAVEGGLQALVVGLGAFER